MSNTLLLIDGNAIMHRSYHALPPFKSSKGIPTNIIYGFFGMLIKAIADFKPSHIVVCFDTPKPTFRNELFKQYQAQRPHMLDDFKVQIPILQKALIIGGIKILQKDGYEADDVIGTLAKKGAKENMKVLILTGDRDIMQLVDKNIFVITPLLGMTNIKLYGEEEVKSKMLVSPSEIPELKALMGDPSDNYPGAKGIGPKTASGLIQEFKTVENLLANLDKVKSEKVKNILKNERENVVLSKKLATIVTDIPLDFVFDQAPFTWFKQELKDYFTELEIKSLKKRIFEERLPVENNNIRPNEKEKKESKRKKNQSANEKNQLGLF